MTNSTAVAPVWLHPRALLDAVRSSHARRLPADTPSSPRVETVWDVLALAMHQQVAQDALLLWRADRGRRQLRLVALTPAEPLARGLTVTAAPQLQDLSAGNLEAVAHVHCFHAECAVEQALASLGLHSGISAALGDDDDPLLMTLGFRERWQLVAHHTGSVVALAAYLRACREAICSPTAGNADREWWTLEAQVPHLWRQPWRPSTARTVHDVTEALVDVAERTRLGGGGSASQDEGRIGRLAHLAADLMARLEGVYRDSRPLVTTEELLAEALLLVRGAYQLCRGDWPGCFAASASTPRPVGSNPAGMRHELVDWVLAGLLAEEAEGAD